MKNRAAIHAKIGYLYISMVALLSSKRPIFSAFTYLLQHRKISAQNFFLDFSQCDHLLSKLSLSWFYQVILQQIFCNIFVATIGIQFFHCKIFPEMTIVTPVSAVISPTVPELKLYFGSDKDSFLNYYINLAFWLDESKDGVIKSELLFEILH